MKDHPSQIHRIMNRLQPLTALEIAGGCTMSFYLASWASVKMGNTILVSMDGLWAMISAILVFHVNFSILLKNSLFRIIGTLTGVLAAIIFFSWLKSSLSLFFLALFFTMMIMSSVKLSSYRLAVLTMGVIFAINLSLPSIPIWLNALTRLLMSCIGISVAVLARCLTYSIRQHYAFFDPIEKDKP